MNNSMKKYRLTLLGEGKDPEFYVVGDFRCPIDAKLIGEIMRAFDNSENRLFPTFSVDPVEE